MKSAAKTVAAYLASLPEDRRVIVSAVRDAVRANLPAGYEEAMAWGMVTYQVPLSVYPDTYNGKPLAYAAIASQKNNLSIYYMCDGGDGRLEKIWANPKRKADMGKSCLRFSSLDDIDLGKLGRLIASTPVASLVAKARR